MNRLFIKTLLGAAACAMTLAASAVPSPSPFAGLVIFGDSLSDSGNNFNLFGGLTTPNSAIVDNGFIPTFPYAVSGVYSNGPVWATDFAADLGLSAAPSRSGGTNYAYGGATTGAGSPTPSLTAQMGQYLSLTGNVAQSNFLYVVAGGGNNARHALDDIAADPGSFASIISNASFAFAAEVVNIVDTLQGAGAQHIVVWNAPNLGVAPAVLAQGTDAVGLATATVQTMNGVLAASLSGKAGVTTFDIFGLVGGVIADPGASGLSNVTNACVQGACDASTYLFWDGIHPTAKGHELIANAMVAAVVPEPQTYALFAVGLMVLGLSARRRRRG